MDPGIAASIVEKTKIGQFDKHCHLIGILFIPFAMETSPFLGEHAKSWQGDMLTANLELYLYVVLNFCIGFQLNYTRAMIWC